jgi:hypothetical protein
LLATVAALLLIPAASQALANEPVKVVLTGSGAGKAYIDPTFTYSGSPKIACTYTSPGPQTGVCETEMTNLGEGYEQVYISFEASPGSKLTSLTAKNVETEACGNIPGSETKGICTPYAEPPGTGSGKAEVLATFTAEPTPNLKVVIEEGEGTVISNPAGISCKPTCGATFEVGKTVTLTASPAPGYLFKGWKYCDTGGVVGRQCTVTITSETKTVGAKFVPAFSLEGKKSSPNGIFSTTPAGVNCGYGCNSSTALYKEGALTLKAKAAKHFHFVEFKGGTGSASSCNGVKALECTIATFNSNSSIEEVYAEDAKSTLTLSKTGGGQGLVKTNPTNVNCSYTCTAAKAEFYVTETAVPVSVTLGKGTSSVTWTTGAGTCTGNAVSCTVNMSESHTLVAKFD